MFRTLIGFIELTYVVWRDAWREHRLARARRKVALLHNRLHTHTHAHGGRWMCPTCNRVHASAEFSLWSGRQFPACCRFNAGHRLDDIHCAR